VLIGADARILDLSVRLVASKYQGVGARVTAFALSKAK